MFDCCNINIDDLDLEQVPDNNFVGADAANHDASTKKLDRHNQQLRHHRNEAACRDEPPARRSHADDKEKSGREQQVPEENDLHENILQMRRGWYDLASGQMCWPRRPEGEGHIDVFAVMSELKKCLERKQKQTTKRTGYIRGILFYLNQITSSGRDSRLNKISKTQLLNKLYMLLDLSRRLPKIKGGTNAQFSFDDTELCLLCCKTIYVLEYRSDLFNRVRYFGALRVAIQSKELDFIVLAVKKITDILSACTEGNEMYILCFQLLSWMDSLVKTCTKTFRSHNDIQVYFFQIITFVTKSTKLEHLSAETVDIILWHIDDTLKADRYRSDELLVGYVSDTSLALFEAVEANRSRCEIMARSFMSVLQFWLTNRTIVSKILLVVGACQRHERKVAVTEGNYEMAIKVMKEHAAAMDIQEQGSKISKYFMEDGTVVQESMEIDALAVFYQAIVKFPDNETILLNGLFCFNRLVTSPNFNLSAVTLSRILDISRALSSAERLRNFQVGVECLSLLTAALRLYQGYFVRRHMNETGRCIITVMELFPFCSGIQEKGSEAICMLQQRDRQGSIDAQMNNEFRHLIDEAVQVIPKQCSKYKSQLLNRSSSSSADGAGGYDSSNAHPPGGGEGNQNDAGGFDRDNGGGTNGGGTNGGEREFGDKDGQDEQKWHEDDLVDGFDVLFLQASPLAHVIGLDRLIPIKRLDLEREREKFNGMIQGTGISVIYKIATPEQFWKCLTSRDVHVLHLSGHGSAPDQRNGIPPNLSLEFDGWGAARLYRPQDISEYLCDKNVHAVKLVFISTCHSYSFGRKLVQCGIPYVICCSNDTYELLERPAVMFQNSFYHALSQGSTIREAFAQAKQETRVSGIMEQRLLDFEVEKYSLLSRHDLEDYKPLEVRRGLQQSAYSTAVDQDKVKCPPTRIDLFKGREVEQCRILHDLRDHRVVRVVGESGIGKKATTRELCGYVKMRGDLLDIDHIMWFGGECHNQDETLREPFEQLRTIHTPDPATRDAMRRIFKHVADMRVLFIIESEFHDTMKEFLSELKNKTEFHRLILIEPGKICGNGNDSTAVQGGHQHKVVTIQELDIDSSLWLYAATKYNELQGRYSFFETIKAVYNRKPVLGKLILDRVGGRNPRNIKEAVRGNDRMNFETLQLIWELACDFDFEWKVSSRTELEYLLDKINQKYKAALRCKQYRKANAFLLAHSEIQELRNHFPTLDDLKQSYEEKKNLQTTAEQDLLGALESNRQPEPDLSGLERRESELQKLMDSIIMELKDQRHLHRMQQSHSADCARIEKLDQDLRDRIKMAQAQVCGCSSNDMQVEIAQSIAAELDSVEMAEIRSACIHELRLISELLLSAEKVFDETGDSFSDAEINSLREKVDVWQNPSNSGAAGRQAVGILLAYTQVCSPFATNLVSNIKDRFGPADTSWGTERREQQQQEEEEEKYAHLEEDATNELTAQDDVVYSNGYSFPIEQDPTKCSHKQTEENMSTFSRFNRAHKAKEDRAWEFLLLLSLCCENICPHDWDVAEGGEYTALQ